jgi:hypothetical protein
MQAITTIGGHLWLHGGKPFHLALRLKLFAPNASSIQSYDRALIRSPR